MQRLPKILILTAGFGDGHLAAARAIETALMGKAECRVIDPFATAVPYRFAIFRHAYLWALAFAPSLWRAFYRMGEKLNWTTPKLSGPRAVERYIERLIDDFSPDLILHTYMTTPYMVTRIESRRNLNILQYVVITDSYNISASWIQSSPLAWLVADEGTRDILISRGKDPEKVLALGFPVHPEILFIREKALMDWVSSEPFRILLFAQGAASKVTANIRAILDISPNIEITCVMGRHISRYKKSLNKLLTIYPGHLDVLGWSNNIPLLMAQHHLIIGKAGGATVHEAIAMRRPMLINHFVAGQEEGNVQLLRKLGIGHAVASSSAELTLAVHYLTANNAIEWRSLIRKFNQIPQPTAAQDIAELCLSTIEQSHPTS